MCVTMRMCMCVSVDECILIHPFHPFCLVSEEGTDVYARAYGESPAGPVDGKSFLP